MNIIKVKQAVRFLLLILLPLLIFHLSVLVKLVPQDIIWGGRSDNIYFLESISLLVIVYLIFTLLIKGSFIKQLIPSKVVNISLWIFLVLFVFNTIGNVFAKSTTEQFFALITMTISILLLVVLKGKK